MSTALQSSDQEARIGLFAGIGAFGIWGFAPLYFKLLSSINAIEIIAHRILWAAVFLFLVLVVRHRVRVFNHIHVSPKTLMILAGSGLLIGLNWLIFVFAVNTDRVLSTSLGYFINPLVSVCLGLLVFKEHLNGLQILAVVLAGAGTLHLTLAVGEFPWIALSLAFSFGLYGLIRKKLDVGPMVGLFWETLMVLPLALGWLAWMGYTDQLNGDASNIGQNLTLMGTGLITVIPLILFAAAVRRLFLSTIGLMQYIAPSLSFCMAVFIFNEPFGIDHAITFGCIWTGLCLYSYSSWTNRVRV